MPLTSVLGNNTRHPDITFHRNGKIDITAAVVKALGIEQGDSLDILADSYECAITVRPHVVKGRFEAQCFSTKQGGRNMRCYSKKLTDFICNRFGADTIRLTTGGRTHTADGTTAITLINRSI